MRIFLVGYMCAGKTTLGKVLAESFSYDFIDLDDYIAETQDLSVPDYFNLYGEESFRKTEYSSLRELLSKENFVMATGGGTPCFFDNMNLMNEKGVTVYLKASESELLNRLKELRSDRPLVKDKNAKELVSFVHEHLEGRIPFYEESHLTVDVDNWDVDVLSKEVINTLLKK